MGCAALDISTSTAANEPLAPPASANVGQKPVELPSNSYSPVIRRCLKEFENIVDMKMRPLLSTVTMLEMQQTMRERPMLDLPASEDTDFINATDVKKEESIFKMPLPPKANTKPKPQNRKLDEHRSAAENTDAAILDKAPLREITNSGQQKSMPRLSIWRGDFVSVEPARPEETQLAAAPNVRRSRRLTILKEQQADEAQRRTEEKVKWEKEDFATQKSRPHAKAKSKSKKADQFSLARGELFGPI